MLLKQYLFDPQKPVVGGTVQEFYSAILDDAKHILWQGQPAQWDGEKLSVRGRPIGSRDLHLSDLVIDRIPGHQPPVQHPLQEL